MTENSFGKTLAKLRKERKLTQQELADLLHVTNKTISKWETNTTAPDIDTLKRISQVLNVPVDVLLGNSKLTIPGNNKHKITKKKIVLILSLLLVSIFLIYYLASNFTLNTKSYSLISGDDRFEIVGNISTKGNNSYYLSIIMKGINVRDFDGIVINNAEYSLIIDDKIIYNNGDMSALATITENYSLSKYISKISVNHNDKNAENLKSVLENGLILQIKYIDKNSEEGTINIPILVKKS